MTDDTKPATQPKSAAKWYRYRKTNSLPDRLLREGRKALAEAEDAAQQLNGADPASCGKTYLRYYRRAGRAAHLEAVGLWGVVIP